ncbi:MAG: ferrous iron transport protein B [Peptococcaceae bacterium]|nr:ferrous iron transport protein B [Peptococcaceae bacterium]
MISIALAGNPNSGKTSLFNELTGARQHVGNWPGVTVEKKEGPLKGHDDVTIVDLPGIYSMSPYTLEEVVSRDYIMNERPDAIINIIDATNLERNLYLTTQVMETNTPMVIALNMMDLIEKRGIKIDTKKLSEKFGGCPVVEISALERKGIDNLITVVLKNAKEKKAPKPVNFDADVEKAISDIQDIFNLKDDAGRYYAIKLFERDSVITENYKMASDQKEKLHAILADVEEKLDNDTETIITNGRYDYIAEVMPSIQKKKVAKNEQTMTDKIDSIVTNRWLSLPIFAAIIFVIYYVSITTIGSYTIDWVGAFFEWISGGVETFLTNIGAADFLIDLVINGIIAGVGAVLGFVPQLMILFFFLSFLEGCGYMSRVAFIMDRAFRRFGLSGKSFIPFIIGTGCGVPAIMATRTIENEKDRRLTIMTTTFMPCGAKLPIIALFVGALFPDQPWLAPSCYLIGIVAIIVSCILLKRTKGFSGEPAPFIIELPEYRLPKLRNVLSMMWEKGKGFIIKAGTIIFVCSAVIWFVSGYNWTLQAVDPEDSILAAVAGVISPIFAPIGLGSWQATAGTISGLVAKENLVSVLAVIYHATGDGSETDPSLISNIQQYFTPASGMAYMLFNLLCAPCFAAIGAIRREMASAKWTLAAVGYQCGFAYVVAFIVYQVMNAIM